jgi:hypothetical protein
MPSLSLKFLLDFDSDAKKKALGGREQVLEVTKHLPVGKNVLQKHSHEVTSAIHATLNR